MDEQTVLDVLMRVVQEVQNALGELPPDLTRGSCPRVELDGWDSLRELEVLMMLEDELGVGELPQELVFGGADQALTLSESACAVCELARRSGDKHER